MAKKLTAYMERAKLTWVGDWRAKVLSRIRSVGCRTVIDFLTRFPGNPYMQLAETLGDDVAAAQLEKMHFEEAQESSRIREPAMDALARDLNRYLPDGWRHGTKGDFDTSSAFAVWATRLDLLDPNLKQRVDAVWSALEELCPRVGWLPTSPNDELIRKAFERGWPEAQGEAVNKLAELG